MPPDFRDWIKENQERAARSKRLPRFMRENEGVVKVITGKSKPIEIDTLLEKAREAISETQILLDAINKPLGRFQPK